MSQSLKPKDGHNPATCEFCNDSAGRSASTREMTRNSLISYLQGKGYAGQQLNDEVEAFNRGECNFVFLNGKWKRLFFK